MSSASVGPSISSPSGVRATRRAVFRGTLAFATMGVVSRWAAARANEREADDAHVALFERWIERAAALTSEDEPNEDAALHDLCGELMRFDRSAFPAPFRAGYDKDGLKIGPIGGDATFQVLELVLEPGAVIRPHNHVGYAFVSLGVRGGVRARHFEPAEGDLDPPTDIDPERRSPIRLREVSNTWLTPGRTSTLTRTRANIHGFKAGDDGAKMIDFGIHFPEPGPGPTRFSALEIDDEPRDSELRIFDAQWIGNPYAK